MVVSTNKTHPLNIYEVKIKASRLSALLLLLVMILALLCIQETFNKGQDNDGRVSGFPAIKSKFKNISMITSKKGEKLLNMRKTVPTKVAVYKKGSNLQKLRSKFYRSYRPRYRQSTLRSRLWHIKIRYFGALIFQELEFFNCFLKKNGGFQLLDLSITERTCYNSMV